MQLPGLANDDTRFAMFRSSVMNGHAIRLALVTKLLGHER